MPRTAEEILKRAAKEMAYRGDNKEFISLEEARVLRTAGAVVVSTYETAGGAFRTNLLFLGVRFATVTPHRVEI